MGERIGVLIESRTGSSRFPGKCFEALGHGALIDVVYRRVGLASGTTVETHVLIPHGDMAQASFLAQSNIRYVQGLRWWERGDLMAELLSAADRLNLDTVVEITGDCPFIDPQTIDHAISDHRAMGLDFLGIIGISGFEVRVVTRQALKEASAAMVSFRRDGTTIFYDIPTWRTHVEHFPYDAKAKYSIDTEEDLEFVRSIYEELPWNAPLEDVIRVGERIFAQAST